MNIRALVALLLLGCSPAQSPTQPTSSDECGVERWHVKNLLDADTAIVNFHPMQSTIAAQVSAPRTIITSTTPRLDFETEVVSLVATIVAYKREDDGDVHLLLEDSLGNQMIAEAPDPGACSEVAKSGQSSQFQTVQTWIATNLGNATSNFKTASQHVTIEGVLFQDHSHGQRGEALNSRELHPVLRISE